MPSRDEVKHLKLVIDNIATVAAGKLSMRKIGSSMGVDSYC